MLRCRCSPCRRASRPPAGAPPEPPGPCRDHALHALRHQLQLVLDVLLEVAVGRAARHGADAAHAAIGLVRAALVQEHLTGRLVGAGQQAADHHRVGAGGQRLDDVAAGAHAAVGDGRNIAFPAGGGAFQHGGELRHADPGHHARGADAARPDADLHRVGAGLDQCQRALGRGDVAGDHLHRVRLLLDRRHRVQHALGMAVRGIHHDHVHLGCDQRAGAHLPVRRPRRWPRRTRSRPSSSLLASGWVSALSMSLTVIRPTQR